MVKEKMHTNNQTKIKTERKSDWKFYVNPICLSIDSNIKLTYPPTYVIQPQVYICLLRFKQSLWYSHIFFGLIFSEKLSWRFLIEPFTLTCFRKSNCVINQFLNVIRFWKELVKNFRRLPKWPIWIIGMKWFRGLLSPIGQIDCLGFLI